MFDWNEFWELIYFGTEGVIYMEIIMLIRQYEELIIMDKLMSIKLQRKLVWRVITH